MELVDKGSLDDLMTLQKKVGTNFLANNSRVFFAGFFLF